MVQLVLPCGGAPQPLAPELRINAPPLPPDLDLPVPRLQMPTWTLPNAISDWSLADSIHLLWFATLTRATYAPNADQFIMAARAVFGPAAIITFTANAGLLTPGTGIIQLPEFVICCISGTTNLGQWMEQVFNTALVSTDFAAGGATDPARCGSMYRVAATGVEARLPGAAATQPCIFCGHSMGGAVAEVLAYKRRLNGRRGDKVLTFGSPKPGDTNLARGLPNSTQYLRRLAVAGDYVPGLPPDLGVFRIAVPAALRPAAATWASYRHPGQLFTVNDRGQLDGADDPWLPVQVAAALVQAAALQPVPITEPHTMRAMVNKLANFSDTWNLPALRSWANPEAIDTANLSMDALGF